MKDFLTPEEVAKLRGNSSPPTKHPNWILSFSGYWVKSEQINTGRNDKCPCGSGIKYKRCCMR